MWTRSKVSMVLSDISVLNRDRRGNELSIYALFRPSDLPAVGIDSFRRAREGAAPSFRVDASH